MGIWFCGYDLSKMMMMMEEEGDEDEEKKKICILNDGCDARVRNAAGKAHLPYRLLILEKLDFCAKYIY